MALMRWERPLLRWPWPEERFDRAFADLAREMFTGGVRPAETWPMHVEEYVHDGTCVIRLEIPGLDPDKDIDVEIADGMVHVVARREELAKEDRPDAYRSEFRYGRFERHIPLPEGATDRDVTASYHDGILEVKLPVAAPAEKPAPQRVAITRS